MLNKITKSCKLFKINSSDHFRWKRHISVTYKNLKSPLLLRSTRKSATLHFYVVKVYQSARSALLPPCVRQRIALPASVFTRKWCLKKVPTNADLKTLFHKSPLTLHTVGICKKKSAPKYYLFYIKFVGDKFGVDPINTNINFPHLSFS